MGLCLEASGKLKEACKVLKKATIIKPDMPEAYFAWGTVLEKMRKYPSAIEKYKIAVSIDPHYIDVYNRWGEVLFLLGRYEDSIEVYKTAIKIEPNHPWSLYDIACVYVKVNKLNEAINYLVKAVKIDKSLVTEINDNPNLSPVRENARMQGVLKRFA